MAPVVAAAGALPTMQDTAASELSSTVRQTNGGGVYHRLCSASQVRCPGYVGQHEDHEGKRKNKLNEKIKNNLSEVEEIVCRGFFFANLARTRYFHLLCGP
jgi:hypothetical protein